jgi:hypothetical protein
MKNFSDTIGNRTRKLSTCSTVPQLTASPLTPLHEVESKFQYKLDEVSPSTLATLGMRDMKSKICAVLVRVMLTAKHCFNHLLLCKQYISLKVTFLAFIFHLSAL